MEQAVPINVRILALDWYMAAPLPGLDACFSVYDGMPIEQVPVIRIWGEKICTGSLSDLLCVPV
jgi:DNA polymerase zeta